MFRWRPGMADPAPFLDHVYRGGIVVAHNAGFERNFWNGHIRKHVCPHWPELRIEQQDCTMARAAALGLPQKLEHLSVPLGLSASKDKDGSRLMLQCAKPRSVVECAPCEGTGFQSNMMDACPVCFGTGKQYVWWNDEPRMDRLGTYCDQDVVVETEADLKLVAMSDRERRVWELDQHINDRGVALDVPMIKKFSDVIAVAKRRLDTQMNDLTNGAVKKCTQAKALAEWITARGVPCTSVAAEEHDDLLIDAGAGDHLPEIREALRLRAEAAKASTAKLNAMLKCVCADGRARGQLAYHATIQGRWAGRLIQPQNLKTREEEDEHDIQCAMQLAESVADPETLCDLFNALFDGGAMRIVSLCLRSLFVAGPGKQLVGGDASNIEGRFNAWLWDEAWKIKAFVEYDAGRGADLYRLAYASSFGIDAASVTGAQRQVGKVQELALGYQGSVGAYVKMARKKGIDLSKVRDTVRAAVDPEFWNKVVAAYKSAKNKSGLDQDTWAAVAIVVKRWRDANPNIVQGWWDLQDAAIEACASPGKIVPVAGGRVKYLRNRGFLWCSLPSGRVIAYCNPRLRTKDESYWLLDGERTAADDVAPWEEEAWRASGAQFVTRTKRYVTYEGMAGEDGGAKMWGEIALYGGMQCAHVVSGIARDFLVDCMFEAENQGMPLVLTVHDELLAECPLGASYKDSLKKILSTQWSWIDGFIPLSGKTWEGFRYAK